jgi:hypothetical protein
MGIGPRTRPFPFRASVGLACAVAAGCGNGGASGPPPTRDVDILFMIDNTSPDSRSAACGFTPTEALFGDPAIRLAEFTRHFGGNGFLYSICESDYDPVLMNLADRIVERLSW